LQPPKIGNRSVLQTNPAGNLMKRQDKIQTVSKKGQVQGAQISAA
jgi:hypothetical protein